MLLLNALFWALFQGCEGFAKESSKENKTSGTTKLKDLHKIFCKKETSTKKAAKKSVELLEKVVFANETKQIVYPILKGAAVKILKTLVNTLAKKWGIGNLDLNTNAPNFETKADTSLQRKEAQTKIP